MLGVGGNYIGKDPVKISDSIPKGSQKQLPKNDHEKSIKSFQESPNRSPKDPPKNPKRILKNPSTAPQRSLKESSNKSLRESLRIL